MPKVHCLIDEAGSIGRMESLKDVLNVGRGFGLRMQLYYQDIGQLNACWENPQGVLANTTKIFFSCQHLETAELISKSLGSQTIEVYSGGTNSGWSSGRSASSGQGYSEGNNSSTSGGSSSNWQPQSRELLKPDEVLNLDPRIAITFTPGMRPIWTRLIRSYEEKALLRPRGFLRRLAAAVWTLLLSALLFVLSAATAAAVTGELREALDRPPAATAPERPRPWGLPDDGPPAAPAPGRPWDHLPQ